MEKILFFFPAFLVSLIFLFLAVFFGLTPNLIYLVAIISCLLLSGLLLGRDKWWGSIFAIAFALYIVYCSLSNWKLGDLECSIGLSLGTSYVLCSIYVYLKNRRSSRIDA